MKAAFFPLFVVFAVSSCASPPTKEELASIDYGPYPTEYEQIIRSHMRLTLKDPESARYEFLNFPKSAWTTWGGKKYGYAVCAYINAKNSFGGYVGNRMSYFMIRNDKVIDSSHGDGEYGDAIAQGRCKAFITK